MTDAGYHRTPQLMKYPLFAMFLGFALIALSLDVESAHFDGGGDSAHELEVANLHTRYDEAEGVFNDQEMESSVALSQQQRMTYIVLAVAGIVLLLFLVLVVYLYKMKKQAYDQVKVSKSIIQRLEDEIRRSNEMKTGFFARISHEVRTPLTLIQGNASSALETKKLPVSVEESLKQIQQSTRQVTAIIDDLLDLSKIDTDQLEVKLVPQNLHHVVEHWSSIMKSSLMADDMRLEVEATEAQLVSKVDAALLDRIGEKLVSWAAGVTVKGGIVKLLLERIDEKARIKVIAPGYVLDKEHRLLIFDRFYHWEDEGGERQVMGLALARELTELMHGTLDVQEHPDGTAAVLTFPLSNEEPREVYRPAVEDVLGDIDDREHEGLKIPSGTKVLIVEDNDLLQEYLRSALNHQFELITAMNGKEALEVLQQEIPDLIVTDIMMPEMDGFEFIQRLKSEPRYEKIPVVVLTAIAGEQNKLKGLRMGVDDYIVKPFEPNELMIKMANLITNLRNRIRWAKEYGEEEKDFSKAEADQKLVLAIREYVLEHVSDKYLTVPTLAQHLGVSERQLYRKVSTAVGMRPAELILEIKLQHAREMLTAGKIDKLAQVTSLVGFETTAYFSKVYFNRFGKKPTDYFS